MAAVLFRTPTRTSRYGNGACGLHVYLRNVLKCGAASRSTQQDVDLMHGSVVGKRDACAVGEQIAVQAG
jgi:hypothetical protein